MNPFFVIAFNHGGDNQFAQKTGSSFNALKFRGEATQYATGDEAIADAEQLNAQLNPMNIQIYYVSDRDRPGEPMVDRKETVKGSVRSVRY